MKATKGERPTFRWKQVRGADIYLVSVRTKAGAPVWAWSGEATTVRLGADLGAAAARGWKSLRRCRCSPSTPKAA
ncbi:MAG: hypothetical protein FJW86_05940 [Actinobacteria bacterium]|nr:hypothetical protein [Actinomycetota bacterium]